MEQMRNMLKDHEKRIKDLEKPKDKELKDKEI